MIDSEEAKTIRYHVSDAMTVSFENTNDLSRRRIHNANAQIIGSHGNQLVLGVVDELADASGRW
jgi:hypothetical protein